MCLKFSLIKLEMTLDENNISVIKIYWFFASEKSTTQLKSSYNNIRIKFYSTKTAKCKFDAD